ncbi:NadR [Sphingobacterium alkalisoli]|uniref:NadR n=1 Tax=Sphingobacterium alkalisoli TaxID=1874115 RepID=A0A4U0GU58_9SPHI|nr:ATP-binding protein [Sphingobacterium alkalisoli]TJY62497.1 NadR [Sphingobacterium alkalisoli]GGH29121.1 hypothetical protein GCM10011418_40170 [Sphingobacterium alkalisoli]
MNDTEKKLLKIAVVGPESTGKSTIARYLAEQYDTVCVPEYARYYCKNLHNNYTLQDEVNMFYGQIALEEALIPLCRNNIMVADVTIMTIKIWCDHLFGNTPPEVKNEISRRHYDFYLLMDIDLPWQDDPLRDFPDQREHFMEVWKRELEDLKAKYAIVSGLGDERLEKGLVLLKNSLASQ